MNKQVTRTEIETVIKNIPEKKAQSQMTLQVNSIKQLETS